MRTTRWSHKASGVASVVLILLGAAVCGAETEDPRRPNVLFIAVDDLRPELGCYGHPTIQSPHIDRLAREGMRFTRAYCQQAVCAPSRASLLSGCRPDTTGIYDLDTPLRTVMPDLVTLPQLFRRNGYTTIWLGKIYHHPDDDPLGWTEHPRPGGAAYWLPANQEWIRTRREEGAAKGLKGQRLYHYSRATASECADVADADYRDGAMTDAALDILREERPEPWFLAVGFHKPHLPFNSPKRYWDIYDRAVIPLPDPTEPEGAPPLAFTSWGELRTYTDIPAQGDLDEAKTRELIHGYYACVSYIDAQIGRLLDELDRLNLQDRTIVILWGDHGWKLGEYADWCKHTNFEYDTHVPLLLRGPGIPAGGRCDALVEYVDIYPTLAELCGLSVPEHCEGASFRPLLADPRRPWKSAAFSQYPRGPVMGVSLRTLRWRYTEWTDHATGDVAARELYDHAAGPRAVRNLAGDPEHADLVGRLSDRLRLGWRAALPPPTDAVPLGVVPAAAETPAPSS